MGWFVWVGLWVDLISHKTRDAVSYSYTNPAEYCSIIYLNIIVLVQLWVEGEGPTIEWSHLPRKMCVRRDYHFEAMEIASYCTKSGRMSRKLGIGEIYFHHQAMSGDIDYIQYHRYRMSRRTFF